MDPEIIVRGTKKFLVFYTSMAFVLFFLMPKNELTGVIELIIVIPAALVVLLCGLFKRQREALRSLFDVSVIILVVAALSFLMHTLRDQIVLQKERKLVQLAIESEKTIGDKTLDELAVLVEAGGNPAADYELGSKLFVGWGVRQDRVQGLAFMKRAAEACHQNAQITLGKLYWLGNGVGTDMSEAEKWLHKASLSRNSYGYEASTTLLAFYEDNQQYVKAYDLCKKTIKAYPHYADSMYYAMSRVCVNLGNIGKAEKYARIAYFEKNISEAGLVLGVIYQKKGEAREAEKVLLALSKYGNKVAMQRLAELYRENNCPERAEFWENLSALDVKNREELFYDR